MDQTTRLGLNKPNPDPTTGDFVDVSKLNDNFDKIDGTVSFTLCTSGARPSAPFGGQAILETDTGNAYVWGGSAWIPVLVGNNIGIGTNRDANQLRKLRTLSGGSNGSLSQVLLEQTGSAAGSRALSTRGGGDTQDHWWVDFDGKMQWGSGTAGGDVTAGRTSSGVLDVSPGLTVNGVIPGNSVTNIYTASGSWTKPPGARRIWVRVQGGGGAGGGAAAAASGQNSKGGGGGAGAYAERWLDASAVTSPVTVTVGSGGAGVSANTGGSGSTSSFGSYVGAAGGAGGGRAASSASAGFGVAGGDGGSTGTGTPDLLIAGGSGGNGNGSGSLGTGGAGGSAVLGGGGSGASTGTAPSQVNGSPGGNYGGGGGGALSTAGGSAATGGAGAQGVVIVTTFF